MTESPAWLPMEDETFVANIGRLVWREVDGMIEVGLETNKFHQNRSGIVHGGVAMTLLDRVIGLNARHVAGERPMATASLTVNFLRKAVVGQFLHGTCTLNKSGRKAAFGEGQLWADGVLIATATGVFMTIDGSSPTK